MTVYIEKEINFESLVIHDIATRHPDPQLEEAKYEEKT